MKNLKSLTTLAATAMLSGLEPGMYEPMPSRRLKPKKEFTVFDQERLDKAQAKRERKAAKRLLTV